MWRFVYAPVDLVCNMGSHNFTYHPTVATTHRHNTHNLVSIVSFVFQYNAFYIQEI